MLFENSYHAFLRWIESKLSGKHWLWKLTLCAVCLTLFLAVPPYSLLAAHFEETGVKLDAWIFIRNQAEDLFHPKDITYDIRRENMIMRWTLPILSFLTHHNILLILLLQGVLAALFLYQIARYTFTLSQDKVITFLLIFSLANIFVTVWMFADVHGYGDGFAYFFMLTALLSRKPVLIFLCLQAAFFTDERAVVAGGYLLLWWIVTKAYAKNDFSFATLLKNTFSGESAAVWIAWAIYFGIRHYVLATYFPGHSYSTIGTPVLFADAHRNGLGSSIWGAFEGTWLLLGAAALGLYLTRRYVLMIALGFGFTILVATGIYVHDIDRALSYGFPFLLIALFVLLKIASRDSVRKILFFTMIICITHPQVFYMGYNKILWLEPLPVKAAMLLDRYMGWNLFN